MLSKSTKLKKINSLEVADNMDRDLREVAHSKERVQTTLDKHHPEVITNQEGTMHLTWEEDINEKQMTASLIFEYA